MERTCGSCGVVDRSVCAVCDKEYSRWIAKKVDDVALSERMDRSDWFQLLNPRTGMYVKIRLSDCKTIHKKSEGAFKNIPLYVREDIEEAERMAREFLPASMVDNILGKVKVDSSGDE
ncbi:MAG: hypothetical protein ACTSPB_00380 [Candidatus Thorarchaeota archaeon]